jgi:hypothetical protein
LIDAPAVMMTGRSRSPHHIQIERILGRQLVAVAAVAAPPAAPLAPQMAGNR